MGPARTYPIVVISPHAETAGLYSSIPTVPMRAFNHRLTVIPSPAPQQTMSIAMYVM